MPTPVSSEPEPVEFNSDHGGHQPGEHYSPSSSQPEGACVQPSALRQKIEELFAIDLRSLALTRVVVALLVLVDLIWRSASLTAFYSDRGLLPRAALYQNSANSWELSLHLISGRTEVQGLLFLISGIFGLVLLAGYRTRLASFCAWLLFISLNSRNPYVVHGGDTLLNMLLFWGMFVPWGARYSVDNALNSSSSPQPQRIVSIGTAALLLQMPLVYFFTGILKNGPEWRQQFTAISYVLNSPDYATSVASWMASWPTSVLKFLTASTIVLEISGAILLFSPFSTKTIRSLVLPGFLLLQIGLGLTMKLGLFPMISIAAMILFIPGWLWDKLFVRLRTPSRTGLRIYYDGHCKFCRKMVLLIKEFCLWPDTFIARAQAFPDIYADMQRQDSWVVTDHLKMRHFKFEALVYILRRSTLFWFPGLLLSWRPLQTLGKLLYEAAARNRRLVAWLATALQYRRVQLKQPLVLSLLCGFFLAYVLLDNLGSVKRTHLGVPVKLRGIGQMLGIHQRWRLFAPSPHRIYSWYPVEARLRDGRQLCLVDGVAVSCGQSGDNISTLERRYRWRTYWRWVGNDEEKGLRPYLARYICYSWNSSHAGGETIDELAIYRVQEPIRLDGSKEQSARTQLWKEQCLENEGSGQQGD